MASYSKYVSPAYFYSSNIMCLSILIYVVFVYSLKLLDSMNLPQCIYSFSSLQTVRFLFYLYSFINNATMNTVTYVTYVGVSLGTLSIHLGIEFLEHWVGIFDFISVTKLFSEV